MNLKIFVTCDLDPDGSSLFIPPKMLSWNGLLILPQIHQELMKRKIRYTAFIRCDQLIKQTYGSPLYLYEKYRQLFREFEKDGVCIAIHPHLYPGKDTKILKEIDVISQLSQLYIETEGFPGQPYIRIGGLWQSTKLMHWLDQKGVLVDSSALPKRRRQDQRLSFDWRKTSNRPYHPSKLDYRKSDTNNLNIIELPMTTVPIKTSYDTEPLPRYINLAYKSNFFEKGLRSFLDLLELESAIDYLTLVFHPDELIKGYRSELVSYSWEDFIKNLDFMKRMLEVHSISYSFQTVAELDL